MKIVLKNLPKISLNQWYAGSHWTKRKKIKDIYKLLVRNITKKTFHNPCSVEYHYIFKSRPLDTSNTIAMTKMIEDILFPNDGYKIVREIVMSSSKGDEDILTIFINEITEE